MAFDLPFWAGLALLGGPVLFARGFRTLRLRQVLENTPTARIRSMAMGRVEVNGQVVGRSQVMAPFSGRECVYWQVDISTRTRRNGWSVVHRNASGQPFFLRDETGLALVLPHGADCKLNFGVEEQCAGLALPEIYSRYMAEQNLGFRAMWRLSAMRFRERILEEGQNVFILGHAAPRPQSVVLSEEDQFEATGTDGFRGSRIRTLDSEVRAVVRRGERDRTFFISQESERQLSFELGVKSLGQLVGGPVLTLFGLIYWLGVLATRNPIR